MSQKMLSRAAVWSVVACAVWAGGAARGADVSKFRDRPAEWFKTEEGRRVADNVLTWQNDNGGWWKAYDAEKARPPRVATSRHALVPPNDDEDTWHRTSTFDNGATYTELRLLARAYAGTGEEKYKKAVGRGLGFVFASQYPSGGWPQRFPLENNYGRFATYNDGAMVGVMRVLDEVAGKRGDFAGIADDATRGKARAAFEKGVDFILKSQIRGKDGKLTAWCQQHDPVTYAPEHARSYELPSISGGESADIALLLMDIENPSPKVKEAVRSAVAWYEGAKIEGKRLQRVPNPSLPKGADVVVVDDPKGETLWARFYDIETNKPFYCGRDGVKKATLAEIEPERRAGYAWLRPFGAKLLQAYPAWAKRNGVEGK